MKTSNVRQEMVTDAEDLFTRLAFCVGVERDGPFQQRLRDIAGSDKCQPLLVRPPSSQAWLMLAAGESLQVLRDPPKDVHRVVLDERMEQDEALRRDTTMVTRQSQVRAEVLRLLTPVFDARLSPTGQQIAELLRWAPVVEHVAYRYFTNAATRVDNLRRPILATAEVPLIDHGIEILDYWNVLHTMSHLLTIASTPGARPWLVELASSFTWMNWTPTFALSRERTLWLMAAAAKSAVAFGEAVVDRYLTKLRKSDHPTKSFDALVGLVAIGLDQASLAGILTSELVSIKNSMLRSKPPGIGHIQKMLTDAIATLREPGASERRFRQLVRDTRTLQLRKNPTLFGLDALCRDPTDPHLSGQTLGFISLPMVVRSNPADYYPQWSDRGFMLPPDEILRIVTRAWKTPPSAMELRTIH